jgi:acyl-coenzyme A synthetase/AMP-(fatty) acid ligase
MHNQDNLYKDILRKPADESGIFILSQYTFGDVYKLAEGIRKSLPTSDDPGDALCLCTEDKALIAAAFLASLAGGPQLILPYSFSGQTLREIHETLPFRRILADGECKTPEGVEIIRRGQITIEDAESFRPTIAPDRHSLTLFTGGSTGKPRLWRKTPGNILEEAGYLAGKFNVTERDIFIATVPPYHIYGFLFSIVIPFISRAAVMPDVYVFPREIISAAEKNAASVLVSVPVHYRVLKTDDLKKNELRLALSSAGMLDEQDAAYFSGRTGVGIHEIYGSTETGGIATRCRAADENSWTPFDNVAWKIVNERLHVRSDFISPDLPVDEEGFFQTGDRAESDGNGRFVLQGRADGIVKIGGKRVDLAEIEAKMKNISGVGDAVVISLPVPHGRENDISALVVSSISESDIRRYLSKVLEPYAIPKRIRLIDSIPVTAAGKHNRKAIERLFK